LFFFMFEKAIEVSWKVSWYHTVWYLINVFQ
jgi:hypothetical protein